MSVISIHNLGCHRIPKGVSILEESLCLFVQGAWVVEWVIHFHLFFSFQEFLPGLFLLLQCLFLLQLTGQYKNF